MKVKYQHRKKDVEHLRIALGMIGIRVEYDTADLINKVLKMVRKKGDDFSMKDFTAIRAHWGIRWQQYFQQNKS